MGAMSLLRLRDFNRRLNRISKNKRIQNLLLEFGIEDFSGKIQPVMTHWQ